MLKPCTSASTMPTRSPRRGERDGEVGGDGGLADAALAARDGVDAGERVRGRTAMPRAARPARSRSVSARRSLAATSRSRRRPRRSTPATEAVGGAHVALDGVGGGAAHDRELHGHASPRLPRSTDDVADHVELGDGPADLGVDHPSERGAHRARRGRRREPPARPRARARRRPRRQPRSASACSSASRRSSSSSRERSSARMKSLRRHVAHREAERDDLAGQVLGVGEVALGALAVLLELHAVAVVLAVLREQDERRRVRGLQRQDERQGREADRRASRSATPRARAML